MKRSYWLVSSILIASVSLAAVGLLGCNSAKKETTDVSTPDDGTMSVAQLCKELSRQKEAMQIRDLLYQFAAHTSKTHTDEMLSLSEKQQDLLEKDFLLSGEELEEVKSLTFRPLDAHYLESCFLMHNVVRQLEQSTRDPEDGSGLEPLELAQFVFGWTCRQVLPGIAQGDDWPGPKTQDAWVPSYIVLQRGFGSPRDRALVFLELARQLHLQGFLFDSVRRDFKSGEALSWPLVGLLLDGNVYLFDPVLCMPVPAYGKSKGVATLAQVLKNPKLFEPLGISRDDLAKSEIVLNCPLSSLAPRMKMLEGLMQSNLSESERSSLFVDAGPLRQEVKRLVAEQTKEPKVVVGIGPAQPGRFSPTRMLHAFLPPEEGGRKALGETDAEKKKDAVTRKEQLWIRSQQPFGDKQIVHNLARLQFVSRTRKLDPLLVEMAEFLFVKSRILLHLYTVEPRQMLLRGQYQPMIQRFRRIIDFLNEAPDTTDADFKEDLNVWKKVALDKFRKNLNSFWKLDPTFAAVLDVKNENDNDPRAGEIDSEIRKQFPGVRPRMLTYVVTAGCCRELLDRQVRYCQAERALENAEALQVRLASCEARGERLKAVGADDKRIKDNAKKAADLAQQAGLSWRDAYSFLDRCTRTALSPETIEKSALDLGEGEERIRTDAEFASLETLQRSWSTYCMARLHLIRTRQHMSDRKAALEEVRKFDDDLKALIKSESLKTGLKNIRIASHNKAQSKENQLQLIAEFSEPNLQIMRQMLALRKESLGG